MKITSPLVDYRRFRFSKLNTKEFAHLKWLILWPLFGLFFVFVERIYQVESYYPVYCWLDDRIPFQEIFIIPYVFWYFFLLFMHLYLLLYDVETFKKMMRFLVIVHVIAVLTYLVFPTCQELRPAVFERDNFLTRFIEAFYRLDTNTNVCPSLHVAASLGVMFAAWHCKRLKVWGWKLIITVTALLICVSTVFVKQHSVVDVIAALPMCLAAYYVCFLRKKRKDSE